MKNLSDQFLFYEYETYQKPDETAQTDIFETFEHHYLGIKYYKNFFSLFFSGKTFEMVKHM